MKRRPPSRPGTPSAKPGRQAERRRNRGLRETLDELVEYVRHVSRSVGTMTPSELEYAEQRVEWLADEIWRLVLEGRET